MGGGHCSVHILPKKTEQKNKELECVICFLFDPTDGKTFLLIIIDTAALSENSSAPECDEYIRIFEYSNIFDPNIYSDIRSYHFLDTNIFGYSFVSTFWIQIYSDIRS